MDRRQFLGLTGAGLAGLAANRPSLEPLLPRQEQPNIIYILAEDLGEMNDLSDERPKEAHRLHQRFRNQLEEILTNQVVPRWE